MGEKEKTPTDGSATADRKPLVTEGRSRLNVSVRDRLIQLHGYLQGLHQSTVGGPIPIIPQDKMEALEELLFEGK